MGTRKRGPAASGGRGMQAPLRASCHRSARTGRENDRNRPFPPKTAGPPARQTGKAFSAATLSVPDPEDLPPAWALFRHGRKGRDRPLSGSSCTRKRKSACLAIGRPASGNPFRRLAARARDGEIRKGPVFPAGRNRGARTQKRSPAFGMRDAGCGKGPARLAQERGTAKKAASFADCRTCAPAGTFPVPCDSAETGRHSFVKTLYSRFPVAPPHAPAPGPCTHGACPSETRSPVSGKSGQRARKACQVVPDPTGTAGIRPMHARPAPAVRNAALAECRRLRGSEDPGPSPEKNCRAQPAKNA